MAEKIKTKKRYKLLLINPYQVHKHFATQYMMARIMGKRATNTALSLPIIAGLTPDNYDIKIVDEEIKKLPKRYKPDIVGITTITSTSERAYEIAAFYKSKGATIIMGGAYVTFNHEEAMEHADAVVLDEAEGIWGQLLEDFERDELKRIYRYDGKVPFKTNVFPRWDLINYKKLVGLSVQATRGCPYKCEFCLVSEMFGRTMRYRDVDNVIEEIKRLPLKRFLFVDDNLTINRTYALELFRKMKPLDVQFSCQCSFDLAKDEELLKEMAEAGCNYIILGFESLNQENLDQISKFQNQAEQYKEAINKINRAGIMVYSSFIVGFDHDTLKEFDRIHEFVQDATLPVVMLSLLGATKGTALYDRLVREGRWYGSKKILRGGLLPVMHYYNFSQSEVLEKFFEALEKLYDLKEVYNRSIPMYEKGYFIKESSKKDVSVLFKIKMTFKILFLYKFSLNKDKHKIFNKIFSLIRKKTLSGSAGVIFLLMLEGMRRHIRLSRKQYSYFASEISKVDKGAWKDMIKNQGNGFTTKE